MTPNALWGSAVGYPSDRLASCDADADVRLFVCLSVASTDLATPGDISRRSSYGGSVS